MPTTTDSIVNIYVRLGDGNDESVRDISFNIPEGIDPLELLDHGWALDGREAVCTIAWDRQADQGYEFPGPFRTASGSMNQALADVQRALVNYLRDKGFTPQFA